MTGRRKLGPIGMLVAGYRSGPEGKGIKVPCGSATMVEAPNGLAVTASHILDKVPQKLVGGSEVKAEFLYFLVGVETGDATRYFQVINHYVMVSGLGGVGGGR